MLGGIVQATGGVVRWLLRRPACLTGTYVDDLPVHLEPCRVYIVGEEGHRWFVAFVCPCGCGETVYLNLLPGERPCSGCRTAH